MKRILVSSLDFVTTRLALRLVVRRFMKRAPGHVIEQGGIFAE